MPIEELRRRDPKGIYRRFDAVIKLGPEKFNEFLNFVEREVAGLGPNFSRPDKLFVGELSQKSPLRLIELFIL